MSSKTVTMRTVDEFGRDLSLKPKQYEPIKFDFLDRFRGMSWAEIEWLLDEEEEAEQAKKDAEQAKKDAEKRLVEREELRQTLAERKKLYQAGLYDLEEGEELDM